MLKIRRIGKFKVSSFKCKNKKIPKKCCYFQAAAVSVFTFSNVGVNNIEEVGYSRLVVRKFVWFFGENIHFGIA